ncbi:hypothetical protein VNI00_000361 [Paramarasmius palmivorus]|uniref:Uncharacterized protein n=1 Tax=Paramarasmius palmivorus TaxID=297713 RepID=A0AAW0EFA5_9AGAR
MSNIDRMSGLWNAAWYRKARNELYHTNQGALILKRFFNFGIDHPKHLVIRTEYLQALRDLAEFFQGQETFKTTYTEEDWEWRRFDEDVDSGTGTMVDKKEQQEQKEHDLEKIAEIMARPCIAFHRSFLLTGTSGIGKTIWLYFVLVERLLRNLPTYFQFEFDSVTYWSQDGVTSIPIQKFGRSRPSQDTWYLLSTNLDVTKPPMAALSSSCRIIQTASPQRNCFEWVYKGCTWHYKWIMKPTSRKELLLMKQYQAKDLTEQQINTFCSRFGTLTREVFKYASTPQEYEQDLEDQIKVSSMRDLQKLVKVSGSSGEDFSMTWRDTEEISHWIMGVYPGPDRRNVRVNIWTPETLRLVQATLVSNWDEYVREMCSLFPSELGADGYLLKDRLRQILAEGGQWLSKEALGQSVATLCRTQ